MKEAFKRFFTENFVIELFGGAFRRAFLEELFQEFLKELFQEFLKEFFQEYFKELLRELLRELFKSFFWESFSQGAFQENLFLYHLTLCKK